MQIGIWVALIYFLFLPSPLLACLPGEIHIREQWINEYVKSDGSTVQAEQNIDLFDKILVVMKMRTVTELHQQFGSDYVIKKELDQKVLTNKNPLINAYLDEHGERIERLTLFYWEDFDNYIALKARFKNFNWQEKRLPREPKEDTLSENYLVTIPEIGMEFQYDNNTPYRKVMWIHFD